MNKNLPPKTTNYHHRPVTSYNRKNFDNNHLFGNTFYYGGPTNLDKYKIGKTLGNGKINNNKII